MKRSSALWALLLVAPGCMVSESHVKSTPASARLEHAGPVSGSRHRYALVSSRSDALEIRAREKDLCRQSLVVRERREEILEKRASPDRFWGAGAAVLGGSVLLTKGTGQKADVFGAALIAGAAALVFVPMMLHEHESKPLPPGERREPRLPTACGDRPLSGATVTVRTRGTTLQATTDVAGRVRFFDYRAEKDMLIYVDDVAVPVVFERGR